MVAGHCRKASPEKATSPMRSPRNSFSRSRTPHFACCKRLGLMSCASMLFEVSSATMMLRPRCFTSSHLKPHCGRASATIASAIASTRTKFLNRFRFGECPGSMVGHSPCSAMRASNLVRRLSIRPVASNSGSKASNHIRKSGLCHFILRLASCVLMPLQSHQNTQYAVVKVTFPVSLIPKSVQSLKATLPKQSSPWPSLRNG